ncbi:phosphatase PAP2 family protein [Subtercola frigoramans]|uniref:Undecaprenyl-diphosphatase n=1 Tax=Subtercola frigoramans TaxID=120298 RepID=A0ABS2L0N6_9MICO|nr:phosphatase PAP2 family protein [Subtercola frigoramans]MBM7470604.1 undecaprenyl-diphosphatase [Subtercola frigoramans]
MAVDANENTRSRFRQKFVVEERYLPLESRRALYRAAAGLIAVGLAGFTVLLIGVLTHTGLEQLDTPVENWFDSLRSTDVTVFMIVLAFVFGPIGMPIIILIVTVLWLILAKHAWRPLVLAVGMVTGVILAQVLAPIVQHPRPPIGLMLAGPDTSFSFPSGHVLGVSDFFLITAFLLASRRREHRFTVAAFTVAVLAILLQVFSRLYLGYHYISDTTASMALSLIILGTVIAVDTHRTVRIPGEPVEGKHSQIERDGT